MRPELEQYQESSLSLLWHRFLRKILGPMIVVSSKEVQQDPPELLFRFQFENEYLDIYIQEYRFDIHLKRWFFRNKSFVLYRFTADGSTNVDERLRRATEQEVLFPNIKLWMFNEKQNERFLLNAYLDVILARLRRMDEVPSNYGVL